MWPIVLIHGFPLDGGMWEGQAGFLRGKGYEVLAPDLPGFGGRAGLGREGTTMEAFAETVHELIEKEAGGRAIVGGFSMGGYVLMALMRAHPEDVAGVMLVDTRAEGDSEEARGKRMESIEEIGKHGTGKVVEEALGKQLTKNASAELRQVVKYLMGRQSATGMADALWGMAKRRDQRKILAEFTGEALIVVGAEDVITPPSVALGMQGLMKHGTLVQVAGAGHLSPMEQPEAVNAAMEAFLLRVNGDGKGTERGEGAQR